MYNCLKEHQIANSTRCLSQIDTAVLSVTAKAKRKEEEKMKAKQAAAAGGPSGSDMSAPTTPAPGPGTSSASLPLLAAGSETPDVGSRGAEPMDTDTKPKSEDKSKVRCFAVHFNNTCTL